jgi:hypothetical protein
MAITDIVRQKRMYFFTGYLVEVVLENNGIDFRGLFLVLMPTKISPLMNFTPPSIFNNDCCILSNNSRENDSVNPEMIMRKYLFLYFYLKSCINGWAFRISFTGSTS